MERSQNSVCLIYEFNRDVSTVWMFYRLLESFTKTFFGENGGTFDLAYSQKVENRHLGTVGGIQGTLRWTNNSKDGVQQPELFSFLLLEYESTVDVLDQEQMPFALNRGVKLHVQPRDGDLREDVLSILEKTDNAFSPHLGEKVQRSIACKKCQDNNVAGYFTVQAGIHLVSKENRCSEQEHFLDQRIIELMTKKQKPFEMKNLLDVEKSQLGAQPFGTSEIREDMLSGKLKRGEQIWILHDSSSSPCNPVARVNAYAHVVIYVGRTGGDVHEVVHITNAYWTRGLMKAKIKKQNVEEVIKAGDQVFLGHKIPSCQASANLPEVIVERALKCAKKPSIVFDYHYRYGLLFGRIIKYEHFQSFQDKLRNVLQHDALQPPPLDPGFPHNWMYQR